MESQTTIRRVCACWWTWRGCLRGKRGARSTSRRWPRLLFTGNVPDRRLRLRNAGINAFELCGAQPARASLRLEPANRLQSTCALADLAWLSSQPTRGVLNPTQLAEAFLHRHRVRSAAAASEQLSKASEFRVAQPVGASPRGEPTDRPRSARAPADLAWFHLQPTRSALHPTPLAEAPL